MVPGKNGQEKWNSFDFVVGKCGAGRQKSTTHYLSYYKQILKQTIFNHQP